MRIKVAEVLHNVTVVIRVTDSYTTVIINSDVGITVSNVEFLDTSVGVNAPMERSVFFGDRNDTCDMRNKIEVVKTVANHLTGILIKICDGSDDADLLVFAVEESDILVGAIDGEEAAGLKRLKDGAVCLGQRNQIVFVLCDLVFAADKKPLLHFCSFLFGTHSLSSSRIFSASCVIDWI